MSLLARLSRTLDRISNLLCNFSAVLLAILAGLVVVEVFSRYLLNRSTLIADEYSGYLFVWLTLFGFSDALRKGQFLRVEIVVRRAKGRAAHGVEAISALLGGSVSAILAWACFGLFLRNYQFGTVSIQPSATPLWIPQIGLPAGFAWLCVVYAELFIRHLHGVMGRQS